MGGLVSRVTQHIDIRIQTMRLISLSSRCRIWERRSANKVPLHGYLADTELIWVISLEYGLPIDEEELDRIDMSHAKYGMLLEKKLFLAPITDKPQKILDLGTGEYTDHRLPNS